MKPTKPVTLGYGPNHNVIAEKVEPKFKVGQRVSVKLADPSRWAERMKEQIAAGCTTAIVRGVQSEFTNNAGETYAIEPNYLVEFDVPAKYFSRFHFDERDLSDQVWFLDPEKAGREDCETDVKEGCDPAELRDDRCGADEALIDAMGTEWVCEMAGAPDTSNESMDAYGLPWCKRYSDAYRDRARELARAAYTTPELRELGRVKPSGGSDEQQNDAG